MILMSEALIFKIKDISQFEKKNEGIFVNVFGYEKREIYPFDTPNTKTLLIFYTSQTKKETLIIV